MSIFCRNAEALRSWYGGSVETEWGVGRTGGGNYYSMPELAMPSTRNEVSFARCTHRDSGSTTFAAPQWSPAWWSSMGPYEPTIVPPANKIGAYGSKNLKFLAKLFVFCGKI